MAVCDRQAGLSISGSVDLLGFSSTTITRLFMMGDIFLAHFSIAADHVCPFTVTV